MRNGNTLLGSTIISDAVIGAGGWMTGLQTADDGTLMGRLDTGTPLCLAPGSDTWVKQLQPGVDVQVADLDFTQGDVNTYAAAPAPSNSAVRYVAIMGWVWVKKPGATYYTKTSLARRSTMDANSSSRMCGEPLMVDPANPAHAIFCAPEGWFRTTDYGDNWTAIASIPAPTNPVHRGITAFDRTSTVTGGITQRFYCFSPGNGVYRTTNGGASFSLLSGSPTSAGHMSVSPHSGSVIVGGANGEADSAPTRFNGTSWTAATRIGGGSLELKAVVHSTAYPNRVYAMGLAGNYSVSTDDGVSFIETIGQKPIVSLDVPWMFSDTGYKSVGGMVERPTDDLPYVSTGVGCWKLPNPPLAYQTTCDWAGICKGIENMVGRCVTYAADGSCALTMQDKQSMIFRPNEVGRVLPLDYGPYRGRIEYGTNCFNAPEDANFWVTTVRGKDPAWTPDRGKTWTPMPALRITQGWSELERSDDDTYGKQGGGGCVAVLSKDVFIIGCLTGGAYDSTTRAKHALYITRDRGLTWTEVVIGNGNAVNTMMANFSGAARKVLARDPYYTAAGLLGRVYFYNAADVGNPNSADSVACRGVWQIDVPVANAAPTVTRKSSNRLTGFNQDIIHNKLVVLGAAGQLGWCGGDNSPFTFRGVDNGTTITWTEFGGTDDQGAGVQFGEVYGLAAGKARFDSVHPTLYLVGYRTPGPDIAYSGLPEHLLKYGLWASYDNGATWKRIATFPGNVPIEASDLDASMVNFGEVTVTLGGMGAATLYHQYRRRVS